MLLVLGSQLAMPWLVSQPRPDLPHPNRRIMFKSILFEQMVRWGRRHALYVATLLVLLS